MLNTKIGVALLALFASTAAAANKNENNKHINKRHLRKGKNHRARATRNNKTILANDITEDVAFWTRSLQSSIPPVLRPPTPTPPTMTNVPEPVPTPNPTMSPPINTPNPTMPPPIDTPNPTMPPVPVPVTTGMPTYSPSDPATDGPEETLPPVPAPSDTPVARDDSAQVGGGGDLAFVSVLVNDSPATGQSLNVKSIVTQASNGDCSISLDLTEVVYVPNDGFTGSDSCVYEACDAVPVCDTATLSITVG